MEYMEVNTIKIRLCSLEVAGWILKDIKLICEQLASIFFFFIRCNCVALALASVAKENEEVIVLTLFSLYHCIA